MTTKTGEQSKFRFVNNIGIKTSKQSEFELIDELVDEDIGQVVLQISRTGDDSRNGNVERHTQISYDSEGNEEHRHSTYHDGSLLIGNSDEEFVNGQVVSTNFTGTYFFDGKTSSDKFKHSFKYDVQGREIERIEETGRELDNGEVKYDVEFIAKTCYDNLGGSHRVARDKNGEIFFEQERGPFNRIVRRFESDDTSEYIRSEEEHLR